jgi:TolA-binding protein
MKSKSKGEPAQEKRHTKEEKPKFRVIPADDSPNPHELSPSEKAYFSSLHHILDEIYDVASKEFKWTWEQLANRANLAYVTVYNLGERQTRFPRYQTVYKLAKAVGWNLIAQAEKKPKKATHPKVAVG